MSECIGVAHVGPRRLSRAAEKYCPRCHGGAFCVGCLEGHLWGHDDVEREQREGKEHA